MAKIVSDKLTPMFWNACKLSTMKSFATDVPISLFRQNFTLHTEEQLNVQISQELNASQAYLAMSNFFGRTEISLKGASSYFLAMSGEERDHALELSKFAIGCTKLQTLSRPKPFIRHSVFQLTSKICEEVE